ncbi:DUF7529 family protein [Natronobacterium texcoconense]|uniref:Uncharacterized protein n=1 Tax=Natronobacterium texcoconense TaxID=1095778 RepID=A0A1H0Z182_NATTX|nr:hypothetical protein [Natronobacterium texcoconense]SDQ21183.1 hypothetical protein SAMN04489842_0092 [Natronobacterium texcoconense]
MTADGQPVADPRWSELCEDATGIADRYRENGWDVVVLDPVAVTPHDGDDRSGLEVQVSDEEYDLVETLVDDGSASFGDAEVYYRPADEGDDPDALEDRRFAIVVERDAENEIAVCLPLTYSIADARETLEDALVDEELLIHVHAGADDRWVTFSHDDPSLFLEEADVRRW